MDLDLLIDWAAKATELAGVGAMLGGAAIGALVSLRLLFRESSAIAYRHYRRFLGRSILLGIELLVAADIIRTIGHVPSIEQALVLALIVAIRAFLGITLEVELEGRWPWHRTPEGQARARSDSPP